MCAHRGLRQVRPAGSACKVGGSSRPAVAGWTPPCWSRPAAVRWWSPPWPAPWARTMRPRAPTACATSGRSGPGSVRSPRMPAAIRPASLVVLPGGSPARLAAALAGTPVGALLPALVDAGVSVVGSSAGAMLLCAWTVVPERRHGSWPLVQRGLGVVARAAVVPHWTGARTDWQDALRAAAIDVEILALPECAGLVVENGTATAVGAAGSTVITTMGRWEVPVGASWERVP